MTSFSDDELWSRLVRWIRDVSGVTVICAYESADRPELPYIMVNFTGSKTVRDHEQLIEYTTQYAADESVIAQTATPFIEREWAYSVHAFGGTPSDLLRPLVSAGRIMQMNEPLYPSVVIHEMSQIRNVPEYINQAYEPRANIDIFLRGITTDGFIVDPISDISFDIERQD